MRWFCSVLVVLVTATACSGDGDPAEPGSGAAEAAPTAPASDVTTTTTLRPPPPTDPPERAEPTIGDLIIPCRPVDPVAIPERPGVASDVITIGTGSDRGGLGTPAAGAGTIEMVEVLVDLCNAHGGIGGRDVRVIEYDAAAVEAVDRVGEACEETVALVGHRFLQEVETAFAAAACDLPLFTAGSGLVPTSPFGLHGHLAAIFIDPDIAGSVVLVGPDTPLAASDRATRRRAIEELGGTLIVVGEVVYPIDSVPNWERVAGEVRALGGGQVHVAGGCQQAVLPFLDVAERSAWRPVVVATASAYDTDCLAVAQPDRLLIELPFLPFEDGADAPATQAHANLLDQIAAPHTGAGILAASEFWRWASAASECLASVAPQCWETARAAQSEWTAGGLHPALAADGTSDGCAVVLGIENGEFVRRLPLDPGTYGCAPELSVVVPPEG